jgi:vancomycin permeability regulator SanA
MKIIVVLGCMLKFCAPTEEMKGRVERAIQFAHLINPERIIFSGGRTSKDCAYSEAGMMKKLAIDIGADQNIIEVEEKSTTTVENAVYVRELLEKMSFSGDLYIITSCYHITRSLTIFKIIIPYVNVYSGLCFECKPERLKTEAERLIIDQNIMSRVEWNDQFWLDGYEKVKTSL